MGRGGGGGMKYRRKNQMAAAPMMMTRVSDVSDSISQSSSESALGFAVGGSKDANTFRDNIAKNMVPLPSSISPEGLFNEYYFDTTSPSDKQHDCKALFCPSYSLAQSIDPFAFPESLDGQLPPATSAAAEDYYDTYMTVGLRSGLTTSTFHRRPLNLVVVMDISGSMSSPFDRYYYDARRAGGSGETKPEETEEEKATSKIQVAQNALLSMLPHLDESKGDSLGIVLFESRAHLALPLTQVRRLDLDKLKAHIAEIPAMGGTNMEDGYQLGLSLFSEEMLSTFATSSSSSGGFDNRIIFLTDAQPNTGLIDENGLYQLAKTAAEAKGIYTTFIGVGLDFNTDLIKSITNMKGASYFSVHTNREFRERMDEGFDYMVSPLVFDLQLSIHSDYYDIAQVIGSPQADEATGSLMKVATLFPSPSNSEGETKGGVVLLHLRRKASLPVSLVKSSTRTIELTASYQDRYGKSFSNVQKVTLDSTPKQVRYDNTGIRKAIVLARYSNVLKYWMSDANSNRATGKRGRPVSCSVGRAIPIYDDSIDANNLSQWERQSLPVTSALVEPYRDAFVLLQKYVTVESAATGDASLGEKESAILSQLLKS